MTCSSRLTKHAPIVVQQLAVCGNMTGSAQHEIAETSGREFYGIRRDDWPDFSLIERHKVPEHPTLLPLEDIC